MMDKTGTLTEGDFSVNHYESYTPQSDNEAILSLFAHWKVILTIHLL